MAKVKSVEELEKEFDSKLNKAKDELALEIRAVKTVKNSSTVSAFTESIGNDWILIKFMEDFVYSDYTPPNKEELIEEISSIIKEYTPGGNVVVYDKVKTFSPFEVNVEYDRFSGAKASIRYTDVDNLDIHIEFDARTLYSDSIRDSFRKITDSEHHYYTGMSYIEMDRLRQPTIQLTKFSSKEYYGGHFTTYLSVEGKEEEFKEYVLTGKFK